MVLITIVTGACKPTYNWGASHCIFAGTPIAGWFMSKNKSINGWTWMITRGTPIYGKWTNVGKIGSNYWFKNLWTLINNLLLFDILTNVGKTMP